MTRVILAIVGLLVSIVAQAQVEPSALAVATDAVEGQSYSLSIQILVMMTLLTLLPAAILSSTAFIRIIIVLSILRQALGTAQTPPNQVLLGVALFLTYFVMSPVIDTVWQDSVKPYMNDEISTEVAIEAGLSPIRGFMLDQTRETDIEMFSKISKHDDIQSPDDVPLSIVIPSFIVSELKTAFQIGFLIFIPFLVIDLVVSSVLMSMGMMMLSPMLISLPFKIMLFVLVDGWALVLGTLASSFYI